jgi:hypothetical protein
MVHNAQGIYIDEGQGLYIPRTTFPAAHAIDGCRRAQPFRDGQLEGIPASQNLFCASSDCEDKDGTVKVESDDEKWKIKEEEVGRMDQ